MESAWLGASLVAVGGLCWAVGRLVGLVVGRGQPYWRVLLPWLAGQAYLAFGLLAAPAPPTKGLLIGAAVTGTLTLVVAGFGRRSDRRRTRALLVAWAVPWAAATLLSRF